LENLHYLSERLAAPLYYFKELLQLINSCKRRATSSAFAAAVEGADAEIAFTLGAEAAAGRDDHVGFAENFIKSLPTGDALRGADPNVRRIHAAENFQAGFLRAIAQDFGVAEIMFRRARGLAPCLRRIQRFRRRVGMTYETPLNWWSCGDATGDATA